MRLKFNDDEAPQLKQSDFDRATFRIANRPSNRRQWQNAVKQAVTAGIARIASTHCEMVVSRETAGKR